MIKIEMLKGGTKIEMTGLEPILFAEAGIMLRELYSGLKKNNGEESAKKMIRNLAENCILSDAEQAEKYEKRKDTPVGKIATEFLNALFGGEDG